MGLPCISEELDRCKGFPPHGLCRQHVQQLHSHISHISLLNEELNKIKHIGLVVHGVGLSLTNPKGIEPFLISIKDDLASLRKRHSQGKDIGGMHSYSLLIANYRGVMALPTEPPYCLIYLTVYDDKAEDKICFNTSGSPSGMCTSVCMCHSLLQFTDMEPENRRMFKGSHLIVPCGAQFEHLLPEITVPHNHRGLLVNPNTGKPYPMVPVGDFCLVDYFFSRCPRDSLLFHEGELSKLYKRGYSIPTY